ncbi:MAG: polysaccharide deacetylase family protein [Elusimicrobia bacterium]|nr:polysaccharide deacetylase family protein [Elusimicrobiota bacterium]
MVAYPPGWAAILIYHSVSDRDVFADNRIDPPAFEEQIRYLSRCRKIVPLGDIVQRLESGADIPSDWAAVTFDDGYADNARTAAPILKKHGGSGSFFPTVGVLDRGNPPSEPFFYDWVQLIVERTARAELRVAFDGRAESVALSTQASRDDAALRIVLAIRERPPAERMAIVRKLAVDAGVALDSRANLYLSTPDLRDLLDAGMAIGSHTLTHADLGGASPADVEREVATSKRELESLIGRPVDGFAYPFGKPRHYNAGVIETLKRAGYRFAVTTSFGFVRAGADVFRLPRIPGRAAALVRLKANLKGINL